MSGRRHQFDGPSRRGSSACNELGEVRDLGIRQRPAMQTKARDIITCVRGMTLSVHVPRLGCILRAAPRFNLHVVPPVASRRSQNLGTSSLPPIRTHGSMLLATWHVSVRPTWYAMYVQVFQSVIRLRDRASPTPPCPYAHLPCPCCMYYTINNSAPEFKRPLSTLNYK